MSDPPVKRRGPGRPPGQIWDKLDHEDVHRWLWTLTDKRRLVTGVSRFVGDRYGRHNNGAAILVRQLESEGRLRFVRFGRHRTKVHEVVDPDVYDPTDDATHVRRRSAPSWG